MSNEKRIHQRMDVTLREYIETKIHDLRIYVDLKIDSLKEATVLARNTMDDRLARMNEFRDALKDQNATFVTKTEHDAFCAKMDERFEKVAGEIADLKRFRDEQTGKADQSTVNWTMFFSIVAVILGVVGTVKAFFG